MPIGLCRDDWGKDIVSRDRGGDRLSGNKGADTLKGGAGKGNGKLLGTQELAALENDLLII